MKVFITICLVIVTFSVAGLGFAMMDHGADHSGCLAAVSSGVNCSQILNPIDLAGMHAGFLAQFTNAIFAKTLALAGLFLALYFLFVIVEPELKFRIKRISASDPPQHFKQRFESWFSLHENSPSFALGRM